MLIKDADGKKQYSKILIIKLNYLNTKLQVFPNPVHSLLQVQLPAGMKGNLALQIIDASGKHVRTMNVESAGYVLITSFNVSGLKQGMYLLRVKSGNTRLTTSFLKE
ncbi:T9SS type A sorting domain-containing protein [Paraflavitalea speifideaquila]|uniref:T9SS type A sorting domain-containing protein n=1 Tax=Paraflavitalea speifideaquila TaxID=3076558 RepID=UPI0028E5BBA2|nr:T9SS type A sorting domain-containing protein [Paraflavitalea speifideiaquila]